MKEELKNLIWSTEVWGSRSFTNLERGTFGNKSSMINKINHELGLLKKGFCTVDKSKWK